MMNLILHSLQPSRGAVNFILAQLYIGVNTIPELSLYKLAVPHRGRYKPFLHGIAKSKPEAARVVSVKPELRLPKTLTKEQVQRLLDACTHTRDRFLLALMYETGMRIGQCLGLTH